MHTPLPLSNATCDGMAWGAGKFNRAYGVERLHERYYHVKLPSNDPKNPGQVKMDWFPICLPHEVIAEDFPLRKEIYLLHHTDGMGIPGLEKNEVVNMIPDKDFKKLIPLRLFIDGVGITKHSSFQAYHLSSANDDERILIAILRCFMLLCCCSDLCVCLAFLPSGTVSILFAITFKSR